MNQIFYLCAFLLFFPLIVLADQNENNLPQPVQGIQIVPDSQLTMTESMRKTEALKLKQQKEKGYIETDSPYPRQLLMKKNTALSEIKENKNNNDPTDTHMKESISRIKLSFKYKEIPLIKTSHTIGFAPIGGYEKNGWTGIKQFFDDSHLGACSLSLYNLAIAHGGARISQSIVRYDVNKKPTIINTEGSVNSGFIYHVSWFDNTFFYDLECANMNYSEEITQGMIAYARNIDKNNS